MTRQEVIDLYFEGDRALYEEYAQACLAQFAIDIALGNAACAQEDMAAMRRLSHGLKSVLQTLGRSDLSEMARSIEEASASGGSAAASRAWRLLSAELPRALDCTR